MPTPPCTHGVILFAHGSRDPLWSAPIEAVAAHIRHQQPGALVRCAYLELTPPSLPQAVQELSALGATALTIVPMFLGAGRHAREDLPMLVAQLRLQHPQLALHMQGAIGENPRMVALMAEIACTPPLD